MASPVLSRPAALVPSPRQAPDAAVAAAGPAGRSPAPASTGARPLGYQRVVHSLVRRELRLLADLATWAPPGEPARIAAITGHAQLIGRLVLHHHEVEREHLWPALLAAVPTGDRAVGGAAAGGAAADEVRAAVADWTARCAHLDARIRDLDTAARQWSVTAAARARDAFALACLDLAGAVDAQTAEEERRLLPLVAAHLDPGTWTAISRTGHCRLTPSKRLLVLGMALEDADAADRARLLEGLPRATRWAWHTAGRRRYRAAVVRLRGAPPAA